jgi:hypothetical protein
MSELLGTVFSNPGVALARGQVATPGDQPAWLRRVRNRQDDAESVFMGAIMAIWAGKSNRGAGA